MLILLGLFWLAAAPALELGDGERRALGQRKLHLCGGKRIRFHLP